MNQPLSNEFLTTSSHHPDHLLHPRLKLALGVLDARLEDELARYRRYRAGLSVTPSSISALNRSAAAPSKGVELPVTASLSKSKAVELPATAAVAVATASSEQDVAESDEAVTANQTPAENAAAPPPMMATASTADASSIATAPPVTPPLPPRTPLSFQNNLPEDASLALVVAAAQSDTVFESETAGDLVSAADSPHEDFVADDIAVDPDYAPSDYLASSEELLRSLAEEEATAAAERNVLEGLLTPLGVGSMLLMLLGSGMFGYLIMNPAGLNAVKDFALKVATFRTGDSQSSIASGDADGSATTTADANWQSNAPALDSNEFFDLSLNNISALRTQPGSTTLTPASSANGQSPLQQLDGNKQLQSGDENSSNKPTSKTANVVITGLTPSSGPTIARSSAPASPIQSVTQSFSGRAAAPVRPAPKPRIEYTPPQRAARASSVPSIPAPSRRPTAYVAPPVVEAPKPPAPAQPVPSALPEPQGNYRIVTPYTNDAALEAAQKSDPNASFRNLDDGAYIQFGDAYGSQAEVEAKASELRDQGFDVEIR